MPGLCEACQATARWVQCTMCLPPSHARLARLLAAGSGRLGTPATMLTTLAGARPPSIRAKIQQSGWIWKTGNTCNDANNVGRSTTTFNQGENSQIGLNLGVCGVPPETFISCVDFTVEAPSTTPAPTQAPTPAPTLSPSPGACADQNENCGAWAANGECEANPNYM